MNQAGGIIKGGSHKLPMRLNGFQHLASREAGPPGLGSVQAGLTIRGHHMHARQLSVFLLVFPCLEVRSMVAKLRSLKSAGLDPPAAVLVRLQIPDDLGISVPGIGWIMAQNIGEWLALAPAGGAGEESGVEDLNARDEWVTELIWVEASKA